MPHRLSYAIGLQYESKPPTTTASAVLSATRVTTLSLKQQISFYGAARQPRGYLPLSDILVNMVKYIHEKQGGVAFGSGYENINMKISCKSLIRKFSPTKISAIQYAVLAEESLTRLCSNTESTILMHDTLHLHAHQL